PATLDEFMQTERHGTPVVYFDKSGRIRGRSIDKNLLRENQRMRLHEIIAAFPNYRTKVFKELDRGNAVDAFAFYHGGMIRPLIEVIGMIYRPYQFDFGLRYLKRSLPRDIYDKIEPLFFIDSLITLRSYATEVDKLFSEMIVDANLKLSQEE